MAWLSSTEDTAKRQNELERRIVQMETDIKRLWRRQKQVEATIAASGVILPPPEE